MKFATKHIQNHRNYTSLIVLPSILVFPASSSSAPSSASSSSSSCRRRILPLPRRHYHNHRIIITPSSPSYRSSIGQLSLAIICSRQSLPSLPHHCCIKAPEARRRRHTGREGEGEGVGGWEGRSTTSLGLRWLICASGCESTSGRGEIVAADDDDGDGEEGSNS